MKLINSHIFGIILGLLICLLSFFGFYYSKLAEHYSLTESIQVIFSSNLFLVLTNVIAFANIIIFWLFLNKKKYYTARGLILITLLIIIVLVVIRFV
jgi:hypothetical protein